MKYEVPTVDDRDVWKVYLSAMWTATVYAADEVRIFDALADKPASPSELAERMGFNLRAVKAVLALLASLGFLVQRGGRYQPNVTGRTYMTHSSPLSWKSVWSKRRKRSPDVDFIIKALKSDTKTEVRPWESPANLTPEMAQSVADSMNAHSLPSAMGAARNFPFGKVRRLLDVGGGGGCYSIVLAQQHPHLHCTVLDLPAMCDIVMKNVAEGEVQGRVDTVSIDMFKDPWPQSYDAIFMSNVLHDWDDAVSADLLARAFKALPSGGQVLLHELLFDDTGASPIEAAAFSVQMLGAHGCQRTFGEFSQLLTKAGFVDPQATSTSIFFSIVSARKP